MTSAATAMPPPSVAHFLLGWSADIVVYPMTGGRGMRRLWRNYNLSIVLAALFLFSWVLQTWTGWRHFAADQQAHGSEAAVFGPAGYVWQWAAATFENWQSEFLQLLTFVVLTAYFIHRGSHESRDGDEELKAMLNGIDERLARVEHAVAPRRVSVGDRQ
jgi:hypothetical protein